MIPDFELMKHIIKIFVFLILATNLFAQQDAIPYTLADRDRLIRVDAEIKSIRNEMAGFRIETSAKIEGLRNEMYSFRNEINTKFESFQNETNTKFDAINQRMDDQLTLLYWGFGILFSMMLFLLGYNIWDRRTLISPLKEKQEKTIAALIEMGKIDTNIREALRWASLW